MKTNKRANSISLPVWMDMAVRELAQEHKRSISGEIEFLVEEAIRGKPELAQYIPQEQPDGLPSMARI